MDNDTFQRQINNQNNHWWFQARKKLIEQVISELPLTKKSKILDFGAGSGVNLNMLKKYGNVDIHEKNKFARSQLKKKYKNINKVFSNLKLKKNYYDLILLADVIEHVKKPKILLKELKKSLKKNGFLLITVPAYEFLFSKKDLALGHYRRYNKTKLINDVQDFEIKKSSYFNTLLFVPIAIVTLFNKLLKIDYLKKVETTPFYILNKLLYFIFSFEKKLIKHFNLPFGLSLYILCKK